MISFSHRLKIMDLEKEIERLIDTALEEDIGQGDFTTLACIPTTAWVQGHVLLRQAGVVAGLPFFAKVFRKLDPQVEIIPLVEEGSFQKAGTHLAQINGPFRSILFGERVALNLIQHASGVATVTASFVKKGARPQCAILDTRKTLPGMRALEKYAVRMGGGTNHRFGLDDRFIVKKNHLAYLATLTDHPIKEAVQLIKAFKPELDIEIEVENQKQFEEALQTEAKAIMLCEMTPEQVKSCVVKARQAKKKIYVESSGAITLDTIRDYADTGVDGISIGDLTHSVQALDMRLRLKLQES
jgi:nicotinate-nucleotide pyrophosphorylase (carboxylating)